ncbi:MAG: hypothetical protein AB7F25_10725 [Deferribacterales bacterium]
MSRRILFLLMLAFTCAFMLVGCGDDGSDGSDADASAQIAELQAQLDAGLITIEEYEAAIAALQEEMITDKVAQGESCSTCHNGTVQFDGSAHQAEYAKYTDTDGTNVSDIKLTINSVVSAGTAPTISSVMTITVLHDDNTPYVFSTAADFVAAFPQKTFYVALYDATTGQFTASTSYSISSTTVDVTNAATGVYTITKTGLSVVPETYYSFAYGYLAKDQLTSLADQNGVRTGGSIKLYDNMASAALALGADDPNDATTGYTSTANVAGCEGCHGAPYRKHGYREAVVGNLPDFVACKACHIDTTAGGHTGWQLLYDDPEAYAAQDGVTTTDQNTKYAYKRSVMADVHMSHNMEFAYPQSMANCVTCHEGKLTEILDNDNFVIATCQSCHAIDNLNEKAQAAYANHPTLSVSSAACNTSCHQDGSGVEFDTIHTGYNSTIYKDGTTKYADNITITVDSASYNSTTKALTFQFTAAATNSVADMTAMVPTVLISGYGYDTKNFIVSGHNTVSGVRVGEGALSTTATVANFTGITKTGNATSTVWTATYDMKALDYTGLVTSGAITKVEIGVLPKVIVGTDTVVAASAASATFDLSGNALVADYFQGAAKVVDEAKCNACHAQLATTFHSPSYGGKITVCRMCHTPMSGGSHLEMQSRSIDSYVHAIHSMQPFDTKNIDWTDDVEAMEYDHHVESTYPNFTIMNCESCHEAGTYDVPDQSESLPGKFSASYTWTKDRNIGTIPSYDSGPGSRACGSCHRTKYINEDEAGDLTTLNAHVASFGYLITDADGVLDTIIETVMAMF